jgi:hypothetical protein
MNPMPYSIFVYSHRNESIAHPFEMDTIPLVGDHIRFTDKNDGNVKEGIIADRCFVAIRPKSPSVILYLGKKLTVYKA